MNSFSPDLRKNSKGKLKRSLMISEIQWLEPRGWILRDWNKLGDKNLRAGRGKKGELSRK